MPSSARRWPGRVPDRRPGARPIRSAVRDAMRTGGPRSRITGRIARPRTAAHAGAAASMATSGPYRRASTDPRPVGVRASVCSSGAASALARCRRTGRGTGAAARAARRRLVPGRRAVAPDRVRFDTVVDGRRRGRTTTARRCTGRSCRRLSRSLRAAGTAPACCHRHRSVRTAAEGHRHSGSTPRRTSRRSRRRTGSRDG